MKIYRNNRGIYEWEDYIEGIRIRKESKKWKTQKDVRAAHKKYIDLISDGEAPDNPKVSYIIEEYLRIYSITRKMSTVGRREYLINFHILPYIGHQKIKSINLKTFQNFQHELINKTYTADGIEKYYTDEYLRGIQLVFKAIVEFGVQHQYLSFNPIAAAPIASRNEFRPKKEYTILTPKQYNQFIEGVTNPAHRLIFSMFYWLGLRSGELMALRLDDINLKDGVVHIYKNYDTKNQIITTTKTDKDRFVDIPDRCLDDINSAIEYAKSENINGNLYIVGLNSLMSKSQMDRLKKQYIDVANKEHNIPYFTYHELRHTHVSTLIDLGLEAKDIAERLGHSVEMVNNTYGHLFPHRKKELMNRLNSL